MAKQATSDPIATLTTPSDPNTAPPEPKKTEGVEPVSKPVVAPALKSFRVQIKEFAAVVVKASDRLEAIQKYKKQVGIIQTIHEPEIAEVEE